MDRRNDDSGTRREPDAKTVSDLRASLGPDYSVRVLEDGSVEICSPSKSICRVAFEDTPLPAGRVLRFPAREKPTRKP